MKFEKGMSRYVAQDLLQVRFKNEVRENELEGLQLFRHFQARSH
jgi:hypothetical protein